MRCLDVSVIIANILTFLTGTTHIKNSANVHHRPANLENVFRGTFRVKKRDLTAKSGTVGRAHIVICLEVYSLHYRNQLRSKIHCSTAIRPRYRLVFLREIEQNFRNYVCINVGVPRQR